MDVTPSRSATPCTSSGGPSRTRRRCAGTPCTEGVAALRRYSEREDFRIVFACVPGNHLHLLGECESEDSLTHAMLCLGTSIAMRVNPGPLFHDRCFVRPLRTSTEVARAIAYVSATRNTTRSRPATCSLAPPETWLLRSGWKRGRSARSLLFGAAEQHCNVIRKGA
jgi:hypothetical protein